MVETLRLHIQPLTPRQVETYLNDMNALDRELGLSLSARKIPAALQEAIQNFNLPNLKDTTKNHLFFTLWMMTDKKENVAVGDLMFKGEPNAAGEVEIGYGTHEEFQNKGYMSEAVGGMANWASHQPNITALLAETERENAASVKTLTRNGFIQTGEANGLITWRLAFTRPLPMSTLATKLGSVTK